MASASAPMEGASAQAEQVPVVTEDMKRKVQQMLAERSRRQQAEARAAAVCAREARRVYVGGAPPDMHDAVIRSVFNALLVGTGLFQEPGPVIDIQSTGRSDQSFRFVEFEHSLAASVAISFSGMRIAGILIRVQRTREYDQGSASKSQQDASGMPTMLLGSSSAAAAASDNPLLRMATGAAPLASSSSSSSAPSAAAASQAGLPAVVRTGEAFVPREDALAAIDSLMERRSSLRDPTLGLSPDQSTAAAACAAVRFGTGLPGVPSLLAAAAASATSGGVPVKGVPGEPKVSVELHQEHGVQEGPPRAPPAVPDHALLGGPEPGSPWTEVYRRAGRAGAPAETLTPELREQLQPRAVAGADIPLHLRGVPGLPARSLVAASTRVLALHNLASPREQRDAAAFDDIIEDAVAFVESLLKGWRTEAEAEGAEGGASGEGEGEEAGEGGAGRKRSRWEAGVAGGSGGGGSGSATGGGGAAHSLLSWKAPRSTGARRLPPWAWDDAGAHAWDEHCRLGEPDSDTLTVFGGKSVVQSVSGDRFLAAVDRRRGPAMGVGGMGTLFLELDSVGTAVRLQRELSGRAFGDRIVVTSFVGEADYGSEWFWGWGRELDASAAAKAQRRAGGGGAGSKVTPAQVVAKDPGKRLPSPQFAFDNRLREAEVARWGTEMAAKGPRALTNG